MLNDLDTNRNHPILSNFRGIYMIFAFFLKFLTDDTVKLMSKNGRIHRGLTMRETVGKGCENCGPMILPGTPNVG